MLPASILVCVIREYTFWNELQGDQDSCQNPINLPQGNQDSHQNPQHVWRRIQELQNQPPDAVLQARQKGVRDHGSTHQQIQRYKATT